MELILLNKIVSADKNNIKSNQNKLPKEGKVEENKENRNKQGSLTNEQIKGCAKGCSSSIGNSSKVSSFNRSKH